MSPPIVAREGRLIARASLEIDGRLIPDAGQEIGFLAAAADAAPAVIAGRAPGDPFHRILVRSSAATGETPRVVLVAETSAAVTTADRVVQRANLAATLDPLPAASAGTVLAADWNTALLADDVPPTEARRARAAGRAHIGGHPSPGTGAARGGHPRPEDRRGRREATLRSGHQAPLAPPATWRRRPRKREQEPECRRQRTG